MTLENRIVRLERQNRWMKCAAVVAVGLFLTLGQSKPAITLGRIHDTLVARRFELVDDQKRVRGMLGFVEGKPALVLFDETLTSKLGLIGGDPTSILLGNEHEGIAIMSDTRGHHIKFTSNNGTIETSVDSLAGGFMIITSGGAKARMLASKREAYFNVIVDGIGSAGIGANHAGPGLAIIDSDNKPLFKAP